MNAEMCFKFLVSKICPLSMMMCFVFNLKIQKRAELYNLFRLIHNYRHIYYDTSAFHCTDKMEINTIDHLNFITLSSFYIDFPSFNSFCT